MKLNPFLVVVGLAIAFLLAAAAARADDATTTLAWDANEPGDRVTEYIVQYRPRSKPDAPWMIVSVPAATPTAVLPVSPFAQRQRNRLRRDSILCGELWFGRFSPQRLRMGNTPR